MGRTRVWVLQDSTQPLERNTSSAAAIMQPSTSGSCPACSARQHAAVPSAQHSTQRQATRARRALLSALYAIALCAALLPPARAAEDAGGRALHKEHSRPHHHHKRRNGKEVMSGRALTDSGGSTQVWYRKAGEVRAPGGNHARQIGR